MVATPERLSWPVRVTWTAPAYQPLISGAGTLAVVVGGLRSILMPPTVALTGLPARSDTPAVADRLSPSPRTVLSAGVAPSMPDKPSSQVKLTTTSALYQPLALAVRSAAA